MADAATSSADTLFNVLFAWKCSSTHHKLALDALNHIRGSEAKNWKNLCLSEAQTYLDGSKAPDDKFKDFKNHVLHVRDNYWGGAIGATQKWYAATVESLRAKKWSEAVFNAGVLSHYFTDPIQPFHTGQSEAEGVVHRAAEWSIACAYRDLTDNLESSLGGWPEVDVPSGDDWLRKMVIRGADLANPHYEVCIDHYDLKKGVSNPPLGLDQEIKDRVAKLIGHAVVGYARVMERALQEAQVTIPETNLTLAGVLAKLTIPIFWITKKLTNARERALVESMYKEFEATGKVIKTLSEDDKTVRAAYAEEVLKKPLAELDQEPPRPIGTAHGSITSARPTETKGPAPTKSTSDVPTLNPTTIASSKSLRRELPPRFELPQSVVIDDSSKQRHNTESKTDANELPQALKTVTDSASTKSPLGAIPSQPRRTQPPAEIRQQQPRPFELKSSLDSANDLKSHDSVSEMPTRNIPHRSESTTQPSTIPTATTSTAPNETTQYKRSEIETTTQNHTKPSEESSKDNSSFRASNSRTEAPSIPIRPDKFYLTEQMPIEKAPSIGAKTAAVLESHGIYTVGDLLSADPDELAVRINDRNMDGFTILTWQIQADLCCDVPNLRGHDAQIIAACCISQRSELAAAHPESLFRQVESFVKTPAGQRILRNSEPPDLAEVTDWIDWARRGDQAKAA